MATRSHSRFTDDVFCTPVPTAAEINIKTVDTLRDEIFFSLNSNEQFRAGLHTAEEIKSRELYEKYPPNFKHENKIFIFDLLNKKHKYSPSEDKSILITRWKPFVPFIETTNSIQTKVSYHKDVFDYEPIGDKETTVEWYLNFANNDLFGYYGGRLLAQDELQVLECVELAALREYLVQTTNTVGSHTVGSSADNSKSVPTPILISNVERVIDLNTKHIYGNAFADANKAQLTEAFRAVQPPQIVNLIAIEAPSHGEGSYTYDQIHFILSTSYTGFKAAQILANKTHSMNNHQSSSKTLRTIIHTGWWGCGAYGNNRQMMLITQMLAAQWAQIDEIIFHTQTDEHQDDINQADNIFKKLIEVKEVKEVIDEIVKLNLQWEKSNNT
ncbi:unnamed protein product [Adineta steineri]|uniref:PARG catalytic Macro domain-containing protein n=1 Tax=Adineta steineri TaxID=433720 RepID=A0A813MG85_9BILA|nr:unnamed protein product [Adineta steineri]CAF0832153.1 unnamed protein product [Adineta steineri]